MIVFVLRLEIVLQLQYKWFGKRLEFLYCNLLFFISSFCSRKYPFFNYTFISDICNTPDEPRYAIIEVRNNSQDNNLELRKSQ